ncbi:MAG: transcription antitermination factor NusB [Chromatiaceae bacterium]
MSGRRSQARRYAVLALYQWQITGLAPAEIVRHFFDDPAWMQVVAESLGLAKGERQSVADALYDMSLFQDLLRGVPEQLEDLDHRLETVLDRPLRQVTPVDLAILRLGVYELTHSPRIPCRAIINEAVELAKEFGSTDDSHRYVNGILDRLARTLRPEEFPPASPPATPRTSRAASSPASRPAASSSPGDSTPLAIPESPSTPVPDGDA